MVEIAPALHVFRPPFLVHPLSSSRSSMSEKLLPTTVRRSRIAVTTVSSSPLYSLSVAASSHPLSLPNSYFNLF
ncbi:hypothetical protein SOVF_052560 [Spinacia oleracea]|nr:hypothetical protein SOVF_052560 [Spinacia oleracea]